MHATYRVETADRGADLPIDQVEKPNVDPTEIGQILYSQYLLRIDASSLSEHVETPIGLDSVPTSASVSPRYRTSIQALMTTALSISDLAARSLDSHPTDPGSQPTAGMTPGDHPGLVVS